MCGWFVLESGSSSFTSLEKLALLTFCHLSDFEFDSTIVFEIGLPVIAAILNALFVKKYKEQRRAEEKWGWHSDSLTGILNKLPVDDASFVPVSSHIEILIISIVI